MALSADTEHMRQAKTPMGQRSFHDPDAVPDWRRGGKQQIEQSAPGGQSEFGDKHGKAWEQYDPDLAEQGFLGNLGKKKDELGGGQVGTRANPEDTAHMRSRSEFSPPGSIGANPEDTAHMRSRSEFSQPESNKFDEKPSDMRMPGVLRNLTQNQRTRMDRLGRQRIEREDLAPLNTARAEYNNQIQDTLKRRRNKKLSDLVAGLNLG